MGDNNGEQSMVTAEDEEMVDNNGERSMVTGGDGEFREENVSEEVESMLSWLFSTDNDAIELSKFLEASAEKTYPMKVKIIDDPGWHPLIFQTAASYITINGNEELCGSSFSDSDTSYMAGIATGCVLDRFVVSDGGAWDGVAEEARWWLEMEEDGNCLVNASAGICCDDDLLAEL